MPQTASRVCIEFLLFPCLRHETATSAIQETNPSLAEEFQHRSLYVAAGKTIPPSQVRLRSHFRRELSSKAEPAKFGRVDSVVHADFSHGAAQSSQKCVFFHCYNASCFLAGR